MAMYEISIITCTHKDCDNKASFRITQLNDPTNGKYRVLEVCRNHLEEIRKNIEGEAPC